MTHKHIWIRSSRKHKRPPRFFVICKTCRLELQAVMNGDGSAHIFTTGRKGIEPPMNNYSIRLQRRPDEYETAVIRRWLRMRSKFSR